MSSLKESIREYTLSLGFSAVGFASLSNIPPNSAFLDDWLSNCYNADMLYMQSTKDKRLSPDKFFPEARSVIVTALNYYSSPKSDSSSHRGLIARYARVKDYHKVITKKLKALQKYILQLNPQSVSYIYSDSGPVMEKQWAEQSGIGWQGKNSLIITNECGSWVSLGILLTSLELEPDPPAQNKCGECKICIDKCPTHAIVAPKVLDARLCLSYWTIESGPDEMIPSAIAAKMNDRLYGCDICQDVCPYNSARQKDVTDMDQLSKTIDGSYNPQAILDMTEEEFGEIFSSTPVKRRKLSGLKKNAKNILKY